MSNIPIEVKSYDQHMMLGVTKRTIFTYIWLCLGCFGKDNPIV